jgi:transposase-like protein
MSRTTHAPHTRAAVVSAMVNHKLSVARASRWFGISEHTLEGWRQAELNVRRGEARVLTALGNLPEAS